jgi:predicted O-linked N-acetylglucosamine transferase (SPINDLY family)
MCSAIQMSPTATSETIREFQEWWSRRHAAPKLAKAGRGAKLTYRGDRKLKVAYHCSWLGAITFPAIMESVLRAHDRSKVSVYGYSPWPPANFRPEGTFDCFRKTLDLTHEQYCELVQSDEIDVLVELSGFSDGNRFGAMALRCAPVQVAYVNHHATTGVPNIDYMITDAIAAPPGEERFFSEQLYRIPGSFLCYNYDFEESLPIAPVPKDKNGFVTFGCFGMGAKLNTDLIGLWASVLHRVPRSVMLICNMQLKAPSVRRFVADRFRRFGIESTRLRLIEGTSLRRKALGYLSEVDISLDTYPYNGGNAVAESFWHGVPVIALKGQRMASRYGSSLVTDVGCPELVGESPAQYVAIAAALARDDERLRQLRHSLRPMMRQGAFTNAAGMARRLEAAYHDMAMRAERLDVAHG